MIIETRKYWVDVQRGIVSSHGERDLAMAGNPTRDGVSIKILCGGTLNPSLSYYE